MATYDFARLADIKKIAGDRLDEVVQGTLLDLTRRVIFRTAVDTGRARGNWQVTYSSPAAGNIERLDPDGNETIADAAQQTELAGGNIWYLTNNLPYIQRLEFEGWSDQSPNGMVRVSLAELQQSIQAQIAELPR